jgi:hypothetical protein
MRTFKIIFYVISIIVSAILLVFAFHVFPIPGTDSVVFIPAALLFSKGYGLANPLYYVTQLTDLTHTNRFNYYVPFYPYILGLLSRINPGIKTIFVFCALFSAASLLLYTRVVISFLPKQVSLWAKIIILISVAYIATYLLPTVGRPEGLTTLLVLLVYIVSRTKNTYPALAFNAVICILFALILATQLICFYFCFLFFITCELLNNDQFIKVIWVNTLRVLAIVAIFCLVLQMSPNGLANTVSGIKIHINYVLERHDRSLPLFIHYWLLSQVNFGFLIIFLLCTIFYLQEIYFRTRKIQSLPRILIILIQLLIAYGIIKFILYASPTVYNATQFILPMSAWLVFNILSPEKGRFKLSLNWLAFITYCAGAIFLGREIILFVDYLHDGKTYDAASAIVTPVMKNRQNVYITQSLWSLNENLNDVKIFDGIHFKKDDTIIVQQAYHPFPPALVGKCTIIYDWGTADHRKFLGKSLTERPQGYSFVICKIN